MIKSKELWLTSLALSNDHSEGTWALNRWLERFDRHDPNSRLERKVAKVLVERALANNTALGVCFSEEHDLLSQWRGYAQDGAGFSVSFDKEKLEQLSRDCVEWPSLQLSKIIYGHSITEEFNGVMHILSQVFSEGAKWGHEGQNGLVNITASNTLDRLREQSEAIRALFTVKNGAF